MDQMWSLEPDLACTWPHVYTWLGPELIWYSTTSPVPDLAWTKPGPDLTWITDSSLLESGSEFSAVLIARAPLRFLQGFKDSRINSATASARDNRIDRLFPLDIKGFRSKTKSLDGTAGLTLLLDSTLFGLRGAEELVLPPLPPPSLQAGGDWGQQDYQGFKIHPPPPPPCLLHSHFDHLTASTTQQRGMKLSPLHISNTTNILL